MATAKKKVVKKEDEVQLEVVKKIGHDVDNIIYETSGGHQFRVKPVSPFLAWNIKDRVQEEWKEEHGEPICPIIEVDRVDGTTYELKHDEDSILDKLNYTDQETGEYDEEAHNKAKEDYVIYVDAISRMENYSYLKMLDAMMYFAIDFEEGPTWEEDILFFGDLPENPKERKIAMIKFMLCSSQQDMIDIMAIMTSLIVKERKGIEEAKKA